MSQHLEAAILAASQPLNVPGSGERRVLLPMAVERLAAEASWPRWKVEALALESDVAPLHYLRNLGVVGREGQIALLRSHVVLAGGGGVLERALDLLASQGVGRFTLLAVPGGGEEDATLQEAGRALARVARNRNASCEVETGLLKLRGGNPAEGVRGASVVAACLAESMDEQLLQMACRMVKAPLVLGAVEASRGHATTVFPGDPGAALVYRPTHPHLEPSRKGVEAEPKALLMVGAWLAEQVTGILLGKEDLLRGRLLYADLDTGEMSEYPL